MYTSCQHFHKQNFMLSIILPYSLSEQQAVISLERPRFDLSLSDLSVGWKPDEKTSAYQRL